MGFITDERLSTLFDVPINLPASALVPGAWLPVSSVVLEAGQKLSLQLVSLAILAIDVSSSTDTCGVTGLHLVNTDYPLGSLATVLIVPNISPDTSPLLQTFTQVVVAPSDFSIASTAVAPQFASFDGSFVTTDAGTYTIVVLNNTTNRLLTLGVTGSWLMDLDPNA